MLPQYKPMALELRSLALFRDLLEEPVLQALLPVLEAEGIDAQSVSSQGAFAAALYKEGGNLGDWLLTAVMECETPYARLYTRGCEVPVCIQQSLARELDIFTRLSSLPSMIGGGMRVDGAQVSLPTWTNTPHDFAALYQKHLEEMGTTGYGVFAAWHMFTLGEGARLLPVRNPDPQRLSELTGYEREREDIILNTRALLSGLPANNILLYGDAGTGKSSTVKALANEFRAEGLRLIEVRKNQLYAIPTLMDTLAESPLKFILFIDDLSFPADDADFTALKAILEGNVAARPANIVVYATSNRRHMVKEKYSDRLGDDMHLSDTMEEEASLSARFGLTVTFLKPDRDLYAEIVLALAKEHGLTAEPGALVKKAEAHAIRHGGRSPRTARQFVEAQLAAQTFQKTD